MLVLYTGGGVLIIVDKPIPAIQKSAWQHLMEPFETLMRAPRALMLSPQDRAEVLKIKIAEEQATKRARIEERGLTQRAKFNNDGYHVVRGLAVGCIAILIIATGMVIDTYVSAWHDIRSKQVVGLALPEFTSPRLLSSASSQPAKADAGPTQP